MFSVSRCTGRKGDRNTNVVPSECNNNGLHEDIGQAFLQVGIAEVTLHLFHLEVDLAITL